MKKIIECVPNFSEGRNMAVIREITNAIESVKGIFLLNVDPGKATNRTVVTFVGSPEEVVEAAFRGIKKAAEVIDMQFHTGEHPRFGATDVCPLIPVSNISMEETVAFARKLAERVGRELGIPVFCYEYAAFSDVRKSLANCRSGQYEGLKSRMESEKWKPDFGLSKWDENVAKTGATAIGARNFLIAYNINLNTKSVSIANAIACDIRESGRKKQENKNAERIPGSLKNVRAIGWYIEEYGIAQVSMNLTDINVTPVHVAFEEVCEKSLSHGVKVTGSELVGLIPLQSILDAGKYFLQKNQLSTEISNEEIIKVAINSLGLNELATFNPKEKIIEYVMEEKSGNKPEDEFKPYFLL